VLRPTGAEGTASLPWGRSVTAPELHAFHFVIRRGGSALTPILAENWTAVQVHEERRVFGGCGFLLEKVDPLRLDLRRVDCWQVALTARTDEPLHLLE